MSGKTHRRNPSLPSCMTRLYIFASFPLGSYTAKLDISRIHTGNDRPPRELVAQGGLKPGPPWGSQYRSTPPQGKLDFSPAVRWFVGSLVRWSVVRSASYVLSLTDLPMYSPASCVCFERDVLRKMPVDPRTEYSTVCVTRDVSYYFLFLNYRRLPCSRSAWYRSARLIFRTRSM